MKFTAVVNNTFLPVGSRITNTGYAYASTAPRYIPKFDATGAPIANSNVQAATSNQTTTNVSALMITKAEPSPESKLLRGVHDHPTVYTVTVTNTSKAATNATTVVDYLPAELEFLGCGQTDNSASVEYPGAPRLTATPAVGANCPTPTSVDTVANPPANGSVTYPAGIYTKVAWDLGTLAAGQVVTIKYAAGIPLRANTLFTGGPSAASLGQTANLDNNTGASTRQIDDAATQTNYVHAAGTYTGPIAAGSSASVVADASHDVTVNDLRIYKSVAPAEFVAGRIAKYTLHVDSGEYTDNSAITITDVLPNGVCPLDDLANHATDAPAECDPAAGFAPSLPYQSVTQNADGTFTVVFQPIAVAKDGSATITYEGRNRSSYTGGSLAGEPIAAGDTFTNAAHEQGTSTPIAATGFTGTQPVRDGTSATQTTSLGTLAKTVGARATPMTCTSAGYGTTNPIFAKGDRACFQLTVPFSTTNQTRNAVVTDFLPDNTSYEAGSVTYPAGNTVDPAQIQFDASGAATGALSWKVGATTGDGSTEVPVGRVFVAQFSVLILDAASGPAPDKPGNIVKLRTTNSAGVASSLRDRVDFQIAAAPPIGLTKGVSSVNGGTVNPANTDHVAVREGDSVVFRVDATNNGTAANANNVPITGLNTWDVLPTGISCAQISAISDSGTCTDPGDAGQPSFTGNDTRSAIVWALGTPLPPGATNTFTYTMTIPAGVSVSSDLVNTAAVRSYTVQDDTPATSTYYPMANIDTSVPISSYDAPAATDNSDVYTRNVAVAKGVVSAINETGNIGAEPSPVAGTRATIGEQVTFTVSATVPAHSTVYNASFADPLPTGLTLNSATGSYRPDAGSAATAALPNGVTFSATSPPTFAFPTTYDNTTGTDQVFTMNIVATMAAVVSNKQGVVRTNTGWFTSRTAASGGTAIPPRTASATVTDVEPLATLSKTNNSGGPVTGGQAVTYTLKPANTSGRPPLHDAWQLDCLPNGLTFAAYGSTPSGVTTSNPVAGNGSNGCPAGYTVLAWNLGDLVGGATLTLTYTATVDPGSAGKSSFTNVASVSGNSLAQTRTSPTDPGNPAGRQYSGTANSIVNVAGATAVKSVSPASATVGDTVTYTTSAVLPIGVNFYNLSLIDQLPNGIDPTSVVQGTATCTNADTTVCTPNSATPLTPVAGPGTATTIGWLLGNSNAASQTRTITVHYTAKVADNSAAIAGAGLTNQMHVAWNSTAGPPPSSAGASFNQSSASATATVTVLEPSISITKSVTSAHPQPGRSFGYSLIVSNANTAATSSAFNVTVTDAVPTGVVVDPTSISSGGTISGADPTTGGGTISWTIAGPLAKNASVTLTYATVLAPSSTLTAAALPNTAKVTGYDSLPSGGRHYTGPTSTATVAPYFPAITTVKTTPSGSTASVGASFPWRITASNTGLGDGFQVGSVDTLPANWNYDTGTAQVSVNGGAASQVEPTVSTTTGDVQTLTWNGLGNLPAGTALTIDFTATPQPAVLTAPGIGLGVDQTNSAISSIQDATGATGNKSGTYSKGPGTATAHIAAADLTLTKTRGTAPTAGQHGSWQIVVANKGPDTATGPFTVTDPFSATGVTNVAAGGTGWTCSGTSPVTCVRTSATDTLPNGSSFPVITVTYDLASTVAAGTTLTNSASVRAPTSDPDTSNNSDTATATVGTSADIAIHKSLSSPALVAGDPVSYRITVSNAGPSAAAGPITIHDPLPAGTTFVSATGSGWNCNTIAPGAVGSTLVCSLAGPLAVGEVPDALIVTVGVPSDQTAVITNSASVDSPTPDPDSSDNTDTVTTTPTVTSDVSTQKTHLTTPFVAGKPVTYQLAVTDIGPSDATGVQVTDTLPTGLTYSSFSSPDNNWSCTAKGQVVTCDYAGPLTNGTTSAIKIVVDLAPGLDVSNPIVNTATVTSTSTDPVTSNNTDSDNSTVTGSADLSIKKTDSGTTTAGNDLTYHLAVHNGGPSDVPGAVTVTDSLPAGLTFNSATGQGWTCGYDDGTRLLTCKLAAGLNSGSDAAVIDIATTVNSDVGASTITNTASIKSATPDPDISNNDSTDPVDIVAKADLTLTKVLTSTPPVIAGTDATFTLRASDAGPSDATTVSVVDHLPASMTFVSYTGTGWTCDATGQDVTCTRATIAADASAPDIVITARVSASTPVKLPAGTATLENNATIDASTPGTRTNPDPVDVPVQARADLTITKTPKDGTVVAGKNFTWHLAVTNDGPSDAGGPLTVTDTLPGYQSYLSASAPWSCTADDAPTPPAAGAHQTVTCTLAAGLAAKADAVGLDIVVQVDSGAPAGPETNTAAAASPTPGANGSDSATVTVTRTASLTVTKTHTGNGHVGSDLPFTLRVHNAGPSSADQVVVTDPLPTGLDFRSATGDGWTCSEADATVTCTLAGTLAPGADSTAITLTATVRAGAYPTVTNTAAVGSTNPALPGTSSTTDPVTVDPDATLHVSKTHVATFVVGQDGSYRITVRNSGPTPTPGPVEVRDVLPTGLTFASATGPGWVCSDSARVVSCVHDGALASGASVTLTLVVHVGVAAYPSVVNIATATATGAPPASGTDTAPVTPTALLSISKTVRSFQSPTVIYAITVTDKGPSDTTTPIVVTDPLPKGLSFGSASGPGWTCTDTGRTVTCTHAGVLKAGGVATIRLMATVTAAAGVEIANVAYVHGGAVARSETVVKSSRATVKAVGRTLSDTGVDIRTPLLLAGLLLLLGGALSAAGTRRRRPAHRR